MANYTWVLNLIDRVSGPLSKIQRNANEADGAATKLFNRLANFGLAVQAIDQVSEALVGLAAPGVQFEKSLADVKAITAATDAQLKLMGDSAKQMAAQFGGDAAKNLDVYKGILSELGPQIADNPAALSSMGRAVNLLAKTMDGDVQGAMSALNTGLQQFGVNLNDPVGAAAAMSTQMNIMAAASQAGAAEVPQIAAALKQAGVAASGAKVSFLETNSAVQVLAKGGIKGAEAGTALRNVIAKLGEGRFMPKDVRESLQGAGVDIKKLSDKTLPFADRLRELAKIQNDGALVSKMFGLENQNAAAILMRGIPELEKFNKESEGTKTAIEMAGVVMGTHAERIERAKAAWKNLGIAMFDYMKPLMPAIEMTGHMVTTGTRLYPLFQMIGTGAKWAGVKLYNNLVVPMYNAGLAALKFGGRLVASAVMGIGTFVMQLARGQLGVGAFAASLRLQGALAIGIFQARMRAFSVKGFVISMATSSAAAVRAGMSWIWAATIGLPALIAGFAKTTLAQMALNVAMNANPIGAIILGVMALAGAVYMVIRNWDTIKGWLVGLGNFILKYNPFSLLLEGAFKLFPGFRTFLSGLWDSILKFLKTMLSGVKWLWDKIAPYLGLGSFDLGGIGEGLIFGDSGTGAGGEQPGLGSNSLGSGLESINGGGSRPTTINIHIAKFQDSITIQTTNMKEGVNDAVAMVEEALMRMVNSVNQTVTQS